ncbi:golgin subfamily A member 4 isoform X2 [Micropterus salmoides]|uniref:golgin subfamily A member 4 isoform X2 n=1 Tax=Micropterus salmoides TaxID=27706 RepID=UPI0018EE01D5|nr:golgin subfamily A member 4 isoform X2 [Micropterus salmoides]
MTSVEKRRSGRKSGGHRKHSDGGYSDTSSGGSFLDETDREVSNLTDRAFRSLCIGDEAVYNDSDLCSSSPCTQRDRHLAFSQSDQGREDRDREKLKRAAHESFSLRVQQYGQDWIHGGMSGAEINRDPQWEVYGERTQGKVSATFQHSFVETSQLEESLRGDQLSFFSNGATEFSSQQRRSRSRVSSLIRAFNSEGQRDAAGMDGKLTKEWNDETSWDKSALMSIQRELSEFSTSYQQNFNSGYFPSAGTYSSRDTNFYSSEVAGVAHMNSTSSFMRSSHSKHSMSAQVNSNFFIHSEFSPFKVWRDHSRFPFQQGEVSGFMHCSQFPKWYETPMYKELSLEAQPQGSYRFEERSIRQPRNNLAPVVPSTLPRSTSTSTMLQKSLAVEKRCESELAGNYPHRKRTQSLGTNRLPSQRPSTASPTIEMSRRVRDTISSVKALQQKIKMMTEQNIATGMTNQGVLCSNENLIPFGNNAKTVSPNTVSSNASTTPFNISQLLTPLVHAHQEAETSDVQQYAVSPQPVEHPPVRAESRGATPDVRMSSYKSRATSLLFNLKDNRKRVKSTYSPTKFKGLETLEKNKQPSIRELRDTVIDIPDFPDPDIQFPQLEESNRMNAASHQCVNEYHSPGLSLRTLNSQPSECTSSDYQAAQMQGEMVHQSGFTGFIPENSPGNQLANGQNLHENIVSFTPYKQGVIDNVETLEGDVYRLKPSYKATETPKLNADSNQSRECLISKANTEQHFNETVGREFTKLDRYQQLKDNKQNVSTQDRWRQTNSQDTQNISLKAVTSPWKQEMTAAAIKELNLPSNKYRGESINKEHEKIELRESFGVGTSSHKKAGLVSPNISNQLLQYAPFSNDTVENQAYYGQQLNEAFKDKHPLQKYYGHNKENEMKDHFLTRNYSRDTDQERRNQQTFYSNKETTMLTQETGQRKQYTPIPKGHEMQSLLPMEAKLQLEHNMQEDSLSNSENASAHTMANRIKHRQFDEVKAEQAMAEHIKAQHAQAELAKAQHWAQEEQPKAVSARLILAGQTGSEKVKAEQAKAEITEHKRVNQAKAEHIKEEKGKEEQTEQSREKQLEQATEEQTKAERTREQKVTEELRNITEGAGAKHMREKQYEQVKAEHAGAEKLKEEHIKTELAKAEQAEKAIIEQSQTEQARRERIKADQYEEEQVRAEQVERERMEAEQIRMGKVQAEQAEAEHRKAEQAKLEKIKEQQAKVEQDKTKVAEVRKVKADNIKVEDVRQEQAEEDSIQVGQVKAEQSTTQINISKEEKVEERKAEQAKLEHTKMELAKVDLTKTDKMQERSAKLAAKLTAAQQLKSEPDKVEQVKTELAKAKAELAKIKEKMRGEQKEKVRNTVLTKEGEIEKDVCLSVNINTNEEYKHQDQATQMRQQREDLVVVSRQSEDQGNRGADDYKCFREECGFTDSASTNRNKLSAAGNVSWNDANQTPSLSFNKVEATNNGKSKDKHSPTSRFATPNTENKEEGSSFKSIKVTENHYVYSESSKEFKLSGDDYIPSNVNAKSENSNTVTDKVKDDRVENDDPHRKHTDVSQQQDSDLVKPILLERKPKSIEHSVGKDPHFTPLRALSHKERAQTKQEILTSKIKAHAEKEISAIKEKGFAIRDGFISKTSTKQLAGTQSINIRQRPPSQEASKKHESTISNNNTPKHQMEPSGILKERVKSVSPPSSARIPVKSSATTGQLVDHSKKQVPKEPISNYKVSQPPREAKLMGRYTMSTDEGLIENQKKEIQSGIKSPMQSKEQAPKNKQGKQEPNHGENSVKQTEGLKENPAVNTDCLDKKKEDPSQAIALVKTESSKPMTTENAESKNEAVHELSAPSLNLVFGQNETPVDDDSLQITGIMVTVRERKPPVINAQRSNSTQDQLDAEEKEYSNSELDTCNPSSGLEVNKGNIYSKEVSRVNGKDRVVPNTHPTVKEDQTKFSVKNHTKNVQEISTLETRQNNVSENVPVKKANLKGESFINARPQSETQLQPLAEKGVSSTVTYLPSKVLAETQPLLYNQDIIATETKEHTNTMPKENSAKSIRTGEVKINTEEETPLKKQTAQISENQMTKEVNTGLSYINDSNGADGETLIKHDVQPSVKEDMTTVINLSKNGNIDGKSAPLPEEKRHDATPPKPFNKISLSNHLTANDNRNVSPKQTHIGENNQVDDDLHIGSIAIRVVPAETDKHNLKMAGKHHVTIDPSDVGKANKHKQVASSSHDEKVNTLSNEDRTKDLTPTSSEKQMKDSLEDKLGVHYAMSSVKKLSDSLKICNQQNNMNAISENTQAENGKPEKVNRSVKALNESKIKPTEIDYFQVQGVAETNSEPHNSANAGDISDAVSKGRELPGLLPNNAAISNESYNEGKNAVFELDQSKRKTVELSSVRVLDESMKRKNRETEDSLASKQSDGPTEIQSNKNEKTAADHAIHIRKHHTEDQPSLSARERQNSRNSHTTRETPEVKPKTKERISTIPEISAIADYARLKVIVSEDQANTIQEFPPNKKEGFFPLIQTRHSRCPVFTADLQDVPVKEKSLPNKTEVSSKLNKEPKPLVFPITEKEHQRTGMFKLGDKERQENMLSDVKVNEDVLDTGAKHAQHLKEINKSPTAHLKNQGSEEQVAGIQRLRQIDQSIHKPNNPPLQATTSSSSSVSRPKNTSVSHNLKPLDNSNPHEKPECSSKAERKPYLDKSSHPLGGIYNIKESTTTLRKDEMSALAKNGEDRTENLKQERLATQREETKVKQQSTPKHLDEKQASRIEVEKRAEDMKIKHMLEESRASLAEEERRAAQREDERRAREREAIAIKIKERREKLREAERRTEEDRKAKKTEEERAAQKAEEMRAKQREEERRMKETEEKRRVKIEEEKRAKLREEEERIKEDEEKRRVKLQEDRAAQEEQQKRAAQEEQQRRAAQAEQERRAAQAEQERRAAQEELERRAAEEAQQKRAAQEEQQRRAAQAEQERRAAQAEQERRAAQEELERRAAEEAQQRRAAQAEQERRAAQEELERRAAEEAQQKRAAQEAQQRRAAQEELERRAAREELERRAAEEEQKRRAAQEAQQWRAAQAEQERRDAREEEQKRRAALIEEKILADIEVEKKRKQREEEKTTQISEEEKIKQIKEQNKAKQQIEQKRAAQRMDALQYYAITSTESERKARERQLCSPSPSHPRNNPPGLESTEDSGSHPWPYRPHAPASPAPSLPRSNTSSPALGAKPSMFRVKDNTIRGSSFTKSVKPRFYKNFGEDFRVGSPIGSERGEEEQETMRRSAGTPVHPDTGLHRLAAIKESTTFQPASSSQSYSAPLPHHKPYSRRSIALDEDDSRSVISNMSEDVESFATSATDLADVRGLYDYERPESACSFSSDVSRSYGKPPAVPPKSEKALRRAKRLTTRRIKKELSKSAADDPARVEKPLQEVSSSSTEVISPCDSPPGPTACQREPELWTSSP